jgi:FAD/FMN-containing dehydrogenase
VSPAAEWSNWAGCVRCRPARILEPPDEAGVREAVRAAAREGLGVRVVGTGHSFTPLVATDGVLLGLDALRGIEAHDVEAREVTVRAGTKIRDLGDPLLGLGLALENQGDVDVQSLAGAVSTGTHGTGRRLRNLSSQLRGLRWVTASGDVRECSAESDPDLFAAARVSLGTLGVITAVRLRCVPAYRLRERIWRTTVDDILDGLEQRVDEHRHFEFFWYPRQDEVEAKTLDPTDAPPGAPAAADPGAASVRVGWSKDVISSVRELKFFEMEYSLPAELGPACFRALRERIRTRHPKVAWPVEYRTVAADPAWLSPAHGRETVTLSVHQDGRYPFREFFADVEGILRDAGGRPHWGKIHTRTASELRGLYPRWDDFLAVRRAHDPDGRFLNDTLRELLR